MAQPPDPWLNEPIRGGIKAVNQQEKNRPDEKITEHQEDGDHHQMPRAWSG
jgi:hypothetical protein